MSCNGMIYEYSAMSQSLISGAILPPKSEMHASTTASIYIDYTEVAEAKGLLQNCLNVETQDDEKLYEITLFSVCGDSIFAGKLQTELFV